MGARDAGSPPPHTRVRSNTTMQIAWPPAQEAPPLALRVCTSRAEPDAVTSALGELGAEIRRWDPIPAALHVTKAGDPRSLPGFSEGHWTVQDPGAQVSAHDVEPRRPAYYSICAPNTLI